MENCHNCITLKEHFEQLIQAQRELFEVKFKNQEDNLILAREVNNKALTELNGLRKEVNEDRNLFIRTDVFYPFSDSIKASIIEMKTSIRLYAASITIIMATISLLMQWYK